MNNVYIYLGLMAITTYIIRLLPFTIFTKPIKNKTLRSFLYYVPYVTLSVMTFPAIIEATGSVYSGLIAFVVGIVAAWLEVNMVGCAVICCISVYIAELFL